MFGHLYLPRKCKTPSEAKQSNDHVKQSQPEYSKWNLKYKKIVKCIWSPNFRKDYRKLKTRAIYNRKCIALSRGKQ